MFDVHSHAVLSAFEFHVELASLCNILKFYKTHVLFRVIGHKFNLSVHHLILSDMILVHLILP